MFSFSNHFKLKSVKSVVGCQVTEADLCHTQLRLHLSETKGAAKAAKAFQVLSKSHAQESW